MIGDLKAGDMVTIVPDDGLPEYVKKHYGKVLRVTKAVETSFGDGEYLYKVGRIPNYAMRDNLELCKEEHHINLKH